MRRASSFRARRTPTTSASSTCVSSYAGEWRQRSRPSSCSTCCSRAAQTCRPTTWRARAHCSTSWRRVRAGCLLPTISAGRSRERMPPVQRPDAWSRFAASFRASREPKSSRCSRHSGRWTRIATWRWPATLRAGSRRARHSPAHACCSPERLWMARHCTRPSNRTAPSSLPKSARGEAAPRETTCALTTTRLPRSPTSIEPTRSVRAHPWTRCAAGRRACWTRSMPSSCRCPRTTRCSVGTIRRYATC